MKQISNVFSIICSGIFAYGNVGDLEEFEISGFLDKFLSFFESLYCIDKVSWQYISHLRFDILYKMKRIAPNEEKIAELSVSRPLRGLSDINCLKFKPTKC